MADLPHPWGAYLRLQEQLDSSTRLDDRNWGLEAGLNSIIESDVTTSESVNEESARAVASGARAERYRQQLRLKFLPKGEPKIDERPMLDARAELRRLHSCVTSADWQLLVTVAQGHEYKELGSPGKLRARALRIRRQLADAA